MKNMPKPRTAYEIAELADFQNPALWKRSKRGNLWCIFHGAFLTVFRSRTRYRWIADDGCTIEYAPNAYATVEEAISALAEHIGLAKRQSTTKRKKMGLPHKRNL